MSCRLTARQPTHCSLGSKPTESAALRKSGESSKNLAMASFTLERSTATRLATWSACLASNMETSSTIFASALPKTASFAAHSAMRSSVARSPARSSSVRKSRASRVCWPWRASYLLVSSFAILEPFSSMRTPSTSKSSCQVNRASSFSSCKVTISLSAFLSAISCSCFSSAQIRWFSCLTCSLEVLSLRWKDANNVSICTLWLVVSS
mmetsp:Transcript_74146/g.188123  ORF Transcript_74146/g.188123 Transcript_74146/m.188123 type:complete len:208 (-) Transcript_74146:973-1596(-)